MTSFGELADAESLNGAEGKRRSADAVLDDVVAPRPSARRSGRGAADLRRRLLSLQRAADDELRRRGVIALSGSAGTAGRAARVRGMLGGVAARPRVVLGSLPDPRRAGAGLSRLPRPPILRRIPGRASLQQELPMQLMGAVGQLAITLRNLTGRDVIDLESLNELLSFAYRAAEVRRQHNALQYELDDFGFDPVWTDALLPLARLVYRKYWRVEASGVQHVPRRGGALLVSNHAGVLPFDGAMIKVALFEHGLDRHARALIADWFFTLPMLSWFLRRSGQTLGHPRDTHRLLSKGELVLVFPEGVKGTGKLWSERYRLRRFGRGGFVETAIRAGVPIVPISVVGSEELYPMLADVRPLAQLTGFPYFPLTPTWPWLGPLGLVPLPSKWRIEFHPPIRTDELPVSAADDPSIVMRYADQVRDTIQDGLVANLMQRRNVFRG
jgi:1-acyl-sn-glycerol-3-phosphate acyltransferase